MIQFGESFFLPDFLFWKPMSCDCLDNLLSDHEHPG
jgi:hypothetical protein